MSTASPLPLQPLPPSTVSEAEARALKQQVASRLAEHRQRRNRHADQSPLPMEIPQSARHSRIADSVAERFSKSVSYRDFLQQEAEAAIRQAEAVAEVARRSAEAIAAAQQQLLDEIEQWNVPGEIHGPAEVLEFTTLAASAQAVDPEPVAAIFALVPEPVAAVEQHEVKAAQPAMAPAVAGAVPETIPEVVPEAPKSLAERLGLPVGPPESAVAIPANLIEFPRQLVATRRARPRLAEGPLRDEVDATPERAQLRIFEVEASAISIEPTVENVLPEWHNIRLDAAAGSRPLTHADEHISFALPLHVAPVSARLQAGAVDLCCVGQGLLRAIAAAAYVSPVLPTGVPALLSAGGTLLAFSLLYQLLFFSWSDATPGMRYARIALCTFGDENPGRGAMRRRILALMLACLPFGLGLIWACLDEEGLGWHDRISRMYPREY